jgi:O-antigen/teichoic acid export membrane protein
LAMLAIVCAPVIARFYHEPRLVSLTAVLATGFLSNAVGVQHSALLQRQMRFTALSVINIAAAAIGAAVAVLMAADGYGYWALAVMTVAQPLVSTILMWMVAAWVPGRPRRGTELRAMMRFGGAVTLNGLIVYIAYNLEKVLLGRFWGVEAIGIYGRAYQLVSIPTENLNGAIGEVAFSALSRVQKDRERVRTYFLKGYSLVVAMTIPITVVCGLFANDVILVVLGPKWADVVPIFRLLTPTIIIFAMINPFVWLLFAIGDVGRSLRIALVMSPLVILGCLAGLPYGPRGVAFGYSAAMTLWMLPHIAWCVRGTPISLRDVAVAAGRPIVSGIVAAAATLALPPALAELQSPVIRLAAGVSLFLAVYGVMLLYVMGQSAFYLSLTRALRTRTAVDPDDLALAGVGE